MLKKRKVIFISIILILTLIVVSYFLRPIQVREKINFEHINRVRIIDGGNGKSKTITNAHDISMIERYFNHLTLYNKLDFKSYGYKYAIDLYENNQMKYSIIPMGDEIKIDGALYRVENKNTKSFDDICNIKK